MLQGLIRTGTTAGSGTYHPTLILPRGLKLKHFHNLQGFSMIFLIRVCKNTPVHHHLTLRLITRSDETEAFYFIWFYFSFACAKILELKHSCILLLRSYQVYFDNIVSIGSFC